MPTLARALRASIPALAALVAACAAKLTSPGDPSGEVVPCETAIDCPRAPHACVISTCVDQRCVMVEAAEKTIVPEQEQAKGDCKIAVCDGRGGVTGLSDDNDWPADDENACTDEVCEEGAPAHPPLAMGAPCEEGDIKVGVCNGSGKCGVCLPGAKRCSEGTGAKQACNDDGQWAEPDACPEVSPVCQGAECIGLSGVAAGGRHTCARFEDGSVRCWGDRSLGRLGDGGASAVSGVQGAAAIAAGADHTCARLADSSAVCWGSNASGELGDGTTEARGSAVAVRGVTGIAQVAAGAGFTCARVEGGQVKCWGRNDLGQLGTGAATRRPGATQGGAAAEGSPLRSGAVVARGVSGAQAVSLGRAHSCALLLGGGVMCWGDDSFGQLGRGPGGGSSPGKARPPAPKPVAAVRGLKDAAEIALGEGHACARLMDGGVRCWGGNADGQLGDGTTTSRAAPVEVKGLSSAAGISLGASHTCALLLDATVVCWGSNARGQLGDGAATSRPAPAPVTGLSGVAALSARGDHTCAHLTSGAIRCWGSNAAGQVDKGQESERRAPTPPSW